MTRKSICITLKKEIFFRFEELFGDEEEHQYHKERPHLLVILSPFNVIGRLAFEKTNIIIIIFFFPFVILTLFNVTGRLTFENVY